MHTVYVGLGSNLGDRQSTILGGAAAAAPQRASTPSRPTTRRRRPTASPGRRFSTSRRKLTTRARAGCVRALRARHRDRDRPPDAHAARRAPDRHRHPADRRSGRRLRRASRSRIRTSPTRAFNLVPLAEIAPELVDPRSGKTIAELAAARAARRDRAQGARDALRRQPPGRDARRAALAQPRRRLVGQAHHPAQRRRRGARSSTATSRWSPTSRPTRPACTCRASPSCSKPRRSTCWRATRSRRGSRISPSRSRARSSARRARCAPTCACAPSSGWSAGRR